MLLVYLLLLPASAFRLVLVLVLVAGCLFVFACGFLSSSLLLGLVAGGWWLVACWLPAARPAWAVEAADLPGLQTWAWAACAFGLGTSACACACACVLASQWLCS